MKAGRAAAAAALAIDIVAVALAAAVAARSHFEGARVDVAAAEWCAAAALTATGGRLAWFRGQERLGLVFMGLGAAMSVGALVGVLAYARSAPGASVALAFDSAGWVPGFAGLLWLAFVFPDGRLPGRRWRTVAWVALLSFMATFVVVAFQPGSAPAVGATHPATWTWLDGPAGILTPLLVVFTAACLCAIALGVVWRFLNASELERRQMWFLAYAACSLPGVIAVVGAVSALTPYSEHAASLLFPCVYVAVCVAANAAFACGPDGAGGVVVSRGARYAVVSLSLAAVFVSATIVIGVLTGRSSPLAAVLVTAAVAATLSPLHTRLSRASDQWFDPERHAAREIFSRYVRELRAGRARPDAIERAFRDALADPVARVWLWLPDRRDFVDLSGQASGDVPPELAWGFVSPEADDPVARVAFDPGGRRGRHDLVRELVDDARLAFEVARLDLALGAQLAEVERARALVVSASQRERHRLERDLHDGAQQRLVSLGIRLRRLQRSLPEQARILEPTLDAAVDEVAMTIADLRRLASGLRPGRLDDGLPAALRDLAAGAPIHVEVDASTEAVTADVEETAYFVACEALANALKHADASAVRVEVIQRDQRLLMTVRDDGCGGADPSRGHGLIGLADRVHAAGGTFTLHSHEGAGTAVVVELPCGS